MVRASSSLVSRISRLGGGRDGADDGPGAGEAARAQRLLKGFEDLGSGWFWETDREGRLQYLSPAACQQIDPQGRGLIGQPIVDIFQVTGASEVGERTLGFHFKAGTSFKEFEVRTPDSGDRSWSLSGRALLDDKGVFRGFAGSGSDLTDKRRTEAEVARLALSDPLTGLANRVRMQHGLDQALARRPGSAQPLALFLLDLDRFKTVNDTLGHQTGDALLKQVAQRLQRAFGESALVGRLGGDEFQVVIPGVIDPDELSQIARSVIASLSIPYLIQGASITIGCSVGIAIAPEHGETAEVLIRNADLALYAAKGDGRGVHKFFQPNLLAQAQLRKQLEDDLREALVGDQLSILYQPQVSTATQAIIGYEALLRWTHPVRGPISPANFIPVAEESGLIEPIGEWVLRSAAAAAARWPGTARVAINVSPIQFAKPGFPALVASALAHSGLPPERLELEITETVFLGGGDATDATFRSLKALGVRLALDDFGTGYSSLGYLKAAPFDKIKIDQSFVRGARIDGSRDAAIIRAIVTLADALEMETTAEGVEAQDEIERIRELGCSHIQGFVYGRPVSGMDVVQQLSRSAGGGIAPSGVKVSRPPRVRMLRSTLVEHRGFRVNARLRDVSSSGAMIDQFAPLEFEAGDELLIELIEGDPIAAIVRWVKAERAGLELLTSFDFRRLSAPSPTRLFGRAALGR
jgi:diguanylate cyclase (GGDEF)-like protein